MSAHDSLRVLFAARERKNRKVWYLSCLAIVLGSGWFFFESTLPARWVAAYALLALVAVRLTIGRNHVVATALNLVQGGGFQEYSLTGGQASGVVNASLYEMLRLWLKCLPALALAAGLNFTPTSVVLVSACAFLLLTWSTAGATSHFVYVFSQNNILRGWAPRLWTLCGGGFALTAAMFFTVWLVQPEILYLGLSLLVTLIGLMIQTEWARRLAIAGIDANSSAGPQLATQTRNPASRWDWTPARENLLVARASRQRPRWWGTPSWLWLSIAASALGLVLVTIDPNSGISAFLGYGTLIHLFYSWRSQRQQMESDINKRTFEPLLLAMPTREFVDSQIAAGLLPHLTELLITFGPASLLAVVTSPNPQETLSGLAAFGLISACLYLLGSSVIVTVSLESFRLQRPHLALTGAAVVLLFLFCNLIGSALVSATLATKADAPFGCCFFATFVVGMLLGSHLARQRACTLAGGC